MAPLLTIPIALNGLTKNVKFNTNIKTLNDSYQQITGGSKPEITWQMMTVYIDYLSAKTAIQLLEQYGGYQEFDLDLNFLGQKTFRCLEFSLEDTHHDYGQLSLSLVQS